LSWRNYINPDFDPKSGTSSISYPDAAIWSQQFRSDPTKNSLSVWLGGLITQVTSLPVCVRIERWIHREYPSLRDEQRLYLDEDVQRTLQGLSKKVERMTPKTIFRVSNSITYAYLRGLEP
jgi:hypothetical protein